MGIAQLGLMPSPEDSPEDAGKKADLLALVQRVRIAQDKDKGSYAVDYPSAKLVESLRAQIADAAKDAIDLGTGR